MDDHEDNDPSNSKRRARVLFGNEEVQYLIDGVEKYKDCPQRWSKILKNYNFNPRRTSVDLKDKWRNIVRLFPNKGEKNPGSEPRRSRIAFGDDEVQYLMEGLEKFKESPQRWSRILKSYDFNPCRNTTDLKDKWRNISKGRKYLDKSPGKINLDRGFANFGRPYGNISDGRDGNEKGSTEEESDDEESDADGSMNVPPVVQFADTEIQNLIQGMERFKDDPDCWSKILGSFDFNPKRTIAELRNKWFGIQELDRKGRSSENDNKKCGRARIPFTEKEQMNLLDGIERYKDSPQRWRNILESYQFHPRRTSVDLKDKWRNMLRMDPNKNSQMDIENSYNSVPWSPEEINTLKKAYLEIGDQKNSWEKMLERYKGLFHPARTSVHLKEKWRNLLLASKQKQSSFNVTSTRVDRSRQQSKPVDSKRKKTRGNAEEGQHDVNAEFYMSKRARILGSSVSGGNPPPDFSDEEIRCLVDGAQRYKNSSQRWSQILRDYPFHMGRTNAELKEKWASLMEMHEKRMTGESDGFDDSDDKKRNPRRARLVFTEEEEQYLLDGMERYKESPQRWRNILRNYDFHPRRTSVDLKDKWRNMVRVNPNKRESIESLYTHKKVLWTKREIEALKAGFKEMGDQKNTWAKILKKYKSDFHPVRTSVHLKDKWRNLLIAAKRERPTHQLATTTSMMDPSHMMRKQLVDHNVPEMGRIHETICDEYGNYIGAGSASIQPLPFTNEEVQYLREGVERYRDDMDIWRKILNSYNFSTSRTISDLQRMWQNISYAVCRARAADQISESMSV